MEATGPRGALHGIKVLEFGHVIAAPYAGVVLADLGAHVIKLENLSHPDESRLTGPHFLHDQSLYYLSLNWGKDSIAIDLANESGRRVAFDLAVSADVVIDNFRPQVTAELGLDHLALEAANPRTITCSITGFGETGPYSTRAGYDYTIQAMSGIMSLTGEPDAPPSRAGIAYADHTGGLAAALAVCAALVERERTGRGRHIDLSLLDVQVSMLTYLAAWHLNAGSEPSRTASSAHASLVPAQNFATADGSVSVFVGNDSMWRRFVRALGDPSLDDPRYATSAQRLEHRDEIVGALTSIFKDRTTPEWVGTLNAAGVACAAVNTVAQTLRDPHVTARHLIQTARTGGDVSYVHVGGPLASMGMAGARGAPELGRDTERVLRDLGYDADRIAGLVSEGAILPGPPAR